MNPAVAEVASQLVADVARAARRRGALRGLFVRVEEPWLAFGARRLAEHDLGAFPETAARVLRRGGAPGRLAPRRGREGRRVGTGVGPGGGWEAAGRRGDVGSGP